MCTTLPHLEPGRSYFRMRSSSVRIQSTSKTMACLGCMDMRACKLGIWNHCHIRVWFIVNFHLCFYCTFRITFFLVFFWIVEKCLMEAGLLNEVWHVPCAVCLLLEPQNKTNTNTAFSASVIPTSWTLDSYSWSSLHGLSQSKTRISHQITSWFLVMIFKVSSLTICLTHKKTTCKIMIVRNFV